MKRVFLVLAIFLLMGASCNFLNKKDEKEVKIEENTATQEEQLAQEDKTEDSIIEKKEEKPTVNNDSNVVNQEFEDKVVELVEGDGILAIHVYLPCYLAEDKQYLVYASKETKEMLNLESYSEPNEDELEEFDELCSDFISEEKNMEFMKYILYTDKDDDGLNLLLETEKSTDDNNKDTDDDGYDDLTEILNGYDPVGNLADKVQLVKDMLNAEEGYNVLELVNICEDIPITQISYRNSCLGAINLGIDKEDDYLLYCDNYPEDYVYGELSKGTCYKTLAKKFNNEKYCENASLGVNTETGKEKEVQSCYYEVMMNNDRVDLCDKITLDSLLSLPYIKNNCLE